MSSGAFNMGIFGFGDKLAELGLGDIEAKLPALPIDRLALRRNIEELTRAMRNSYASFAAVESDAFIFARDTLGKVIQHLESGRLYPSGAWLECSEARVIGMMSARNPQEKEKIEFLWNTVLELCKRYI